MFEGMKLADEPNGQPPEPPTLAPSARASDDEVGAMQELALAIPNSIAGGGLVPQVLNDNDAAAPSSSSFCTALAEALTQQLSLDGEPLKREDLARASRADIRSAVERMVNSSTFLDAALSGQLVEELLLHLAKTGDAALCRNAIAHGASVSCRTPDKEGLTPLMLAAKHGSVECVRVLLNCGAPPDEQSHHAGPNSPARQTALHFACATRHEEAAVELIDAGASLDIKDSRNRKPLEALLGETPSGDPPHGLRRGFFDQNRPERERMHARLDKFAHGRLPSSNVMTPSALYGPLFYSKRSWRKEAHARMPPAMREAVMLVLLHSHRAQPNEAGWLPPASCGRASSASCTATGSTSPRPRLSPRPSPSRIPSRRPCRRPDAQRRLVWWRWRGPVARSTMSSGFSRRACATSGS